MDLKITPAVAGSSPEVGVFMLRIEGENPQYTWLTCPIAFLTDKVSVEQVNYILMLIQAGQLTLEAKESVER